MSGNPTKDCDNRIDANLDPGRNIKIVPSTNRERLSEKQIVDYHSYRESFLKWLLHLGKNPEKAIGYSPYTVYETGYRAAAFDRWVWEQEGKYRLPPDTDDADEYMQEVAYSDNAQSTKGKIEEMLKRYFRWLSQKYGSSKWEPTFSFESEVYPNLGISSLSRSADSFEKLHSIMEAYLRTTTYLSKREINGRVT